MITIGPTGKTCIGDIFDCSKLALEEKLRDYDPCLYVEWNPDKYRGYGCWELRRRPDEKSTIFRGTFEGVNYYSLSYIENGANHIKDFPFLDYRMLEWVKRSDIWARIGYQKGESRQVSQLIREMERNEDTAKQTEKSKLRKELTYELMQDKKIIRDFRERIKSGVNPALLSKFWDQK